MNLKELPGYTTSRLAFYAMNEQAHAGVQFDQQAARALVGRIETWMRSIEEEVEPRLPPRKLKKSEEMLFTLPAKPYKKDGSLSASMLKWLEKHPGIAEYDLADSTIKWRDEKYPVTGGLKLPATMPMTLANQDDLKAYLIESGWVPTLFNFQKDARGKPVRDDRGNLIKTSPKMQENKKLCPNLEAMEGEMVKKITLWLSLRNRKSVVEGWLEDPRLEFDGKLSAGAAGFTSTYRFKHTTCVNVPKAEEGVTLGKEMRSLFIPRPGRKMVGFDASALENRIEAHYCYKYTGGPEYAEEILNGDPHYKNAFVFYAEQLSDIGLKYGDVEKDDPRFKPFRSRSKNGKYGLTYGCAPKKLATTLQLPEWQGEELYDAFWKSNLALAEFRDALTRFWESTGEKKWIKGIDGRRVYTRSKHALVNTAFQSAGAIAMEVSGAIMEKYLGGWTTDDEGYPCFRYKGHVVYRIIYSHDEYQFDAPEEVAEEIGSLGVKSIREAGKYLKLKVDLDGSSAVGDGWHECH